MEMKVSNLIPASGLGWPEIYHKKKVYQEEGRLHLWFYEVNTNKHKAENLPDKDR